MDNAFKDLYYNQYKLGLEPSDLVKQGYPGTTARRWYKRYCEEFNIKPFSRYDAKNITLNNVNYIQIPSSGFEKYYISKDGYFIIGLYSSIDNKRYTKGIHQLVNYTFNGPPPSDMDSPTTDHIDRNKLNNSYTNLRWLSNVDNILYKTGISNRTNNDDINKICEMFSNGKTVLEVYNYFNKKIPYENIMNINQKTHWKNVSDGFSFKPQTIHKDQIERTKEIYETYFRKCLSKEQISKLYNMSIITIREKIRKYFRKFSEHETSICDKQNSDLSGFMDWKDNS